MDLSALQYALPALLTLVTGPHLLYLIFGVALGMVFGVLPAIGGLAGIALVLPFLFGMDPGPALAMMIGLAAVPATSDTFSSVLIGVPGGAGSAATVIDGFPMSKRGEAARALTAAFFSSLIGGLFGAFVLSFAFVVATPILMAIGFSEQLMLIILALTLVGMLTGRNLAKGLASCCLGLLIGSIGAATATGEQRFAFGTIYLMDGIPLVVVALGAFALPEIMDVLRKRQFIAGDAPLGHGWLQGFRDVIDNIWLVLRCSGVGAVMGMLPGMGGGVVGWVAYAHAVQTAKDKSQFGKGDVRGVIGPESANNAKDGGDLIPTLFLGVPSNGTMALFLVGLTVIGLQPGRAMVTQHQDIVYLIIWSLAIANILGTVISILLARPIAKVTAIPFMLVAPFILVAIFFSAYQSKSDWGDIISLLVVGVVGLFMKRFGWSRAGLLIGLVMSRNLEAALYRTAQVYGLELFLRPLALVILGIAALMLFVTIRAKTRVSSEGDASPELSMPTVNLQFGFLLVLIAFVVAVALDVSDNTFLAKVFPLSVAGLALIFLTIAGIGMVRRSKAPGLIFDADLSDDPETDGSKPLLPFMALMAALPLSIALLGFWLGSVVYMFLFLWLVARKSVLYSAINTALLGLFFYVMVDLINARFAPGLLQQLVDLPYPLG
ncbi:tripartite tricarboxylate transporter permease [Devosia ginsengisoli]|uniref:tripartite tricarboxylate transporter permease n=1 Tax=Devosia ginsengisoli TaxID=400770 RepID=UPI0026EEC08A|nr:tripartite tricarboxylate transporter permease [Devosia ginsengisoli]MCR6672630.1 tripartite tricarboxylate transporter permease [Devosia ginsengisoli]